MSSRANPVTRLALLIAAESAERRREIVECARQLGAREVVQVGGVAAALDWLHDQTADVLVCGEGLRGEPAIALLTSVRRVSPATRVLWLPSDMSSALAPPGSPSSREMVLRSLVTFASAVVAPRPGFSCDVPALSLADILQLYRQRRASVSVLISGQLPGHIRLEEGELVHAETNDAAGVRALSRLLGSSPQLVRAEESPYDGPQTISAPFDRVFLDAMDQVERARAVRMAMAETPRMAMVETPRIVESSRIVGAPGIVEGPGLVDDANILEPVSASEPARTVGPPRAPGTSGPELDWGLLSEPAPKLRFESPDASSFVSNGRWWAAGGVVLVALAVLISAMLLSALADAPRRNDVASSAAPEPLTVVERLRTTSGDRGAARVEPSSPGQTRALAPDAGDGDR